MDTATATASPDAAGARHVLARRGLIPVTLAGGSMHPTFREGDLVLVRRTSAFCPGDVALIDSNGALMLHRIVGWAGTRALHAGDSGSGWGVAGAGDLLGRVEGARRSRVAPRAYAALLVWRAGAILDRLGVPRGLFRWFLRFLR